MEKGKAEFEPGLGSLRRWAVVALLAALAASAGDCLLLWEGLAAKHGHSSWTDWAPPSDYSRVAGYYLGIIGLPLFALGYWGVSRAMKGSKLPAVFFAVSAIGVISGALIHSATGLGGHAMALSGEANTDAAGPFIMFPNYILPLILLSTLMTLAGTVLYVYAVATGRSLLPRWAAAVNPLTLTAGLAGAGVLMGGFFGETLAYAAPNAAHIFLFGFLAVIVRK